MLLAIDAGNSQTVIGLYRNQQLAAHWRLTSSREQTDDEIAVLLRTLLRDVGEDPAAVTEVAVCSVVPALTTAYRELGASLFGTEPLIIDHRTADDLPILVDDPSSVGADRIANAVAARKHHGKPVIVVDLGTATTFDVVDGDGAYAGGVIAPGIGISANALFQRGARLGRVEIREPERMVGRTTEESIQAGIFYGAVGGVDHLVAGIVQEMGFPEDLPVVATGGLASAIASASSRITAVDEHLTLEGIRLVAERAT